jgi:4-diphosphocytidyl-2-C-methyl-D-erythritol kinase
METLMPRPLSTRAPAKINLSLHILGQRADGYHILDSLVAFAGAGDDLSLRPGPSLTLSVDGPRAALAGEGAHNLVIKAARLLADRIPDLKTGAFHLVKRLPVAAGIGGGSSDAAAALRLLARLNDLPLSHPALLDAARHTGADVPVCLEARARIMGGIGEVLGPVLRLPRLFAVLVNPGVPVATPDVFRALGLQRGDTRAMAREGEWPISTAGDLLAALRQSRNDLEPAACRLQPIVRDAVQRLAATKDCRLARMSGSGATVFGLFENGDAAAAAATSVRAAHPAWWVKSTILR